MSRMIILSGLCPLLFATVSNAFAVCPLLGPSWPTPGSIETSELVQAAMEALTEELDTGFKTGNTTNGPIDGKSTTISITLFDAESASNSTHPYIFEYHHTATSNTDTVDANSIYRIGDLSQVLTVFTFLVEAGDRYWQEPVAKYVPELDEYSSKNSSTDITETVDWNVVTLGELATHMAGIGRDSIGASDLALKDLPLSTYGFPSLSGEEKPSCGNTKPCTRSEFFSQFKERRPVFLPSSTPIYSNVAFQILSYALETISGKPFNEIMESKVTKPLNMSSTTLKAPKNSDAGVATKNASASGWSVDMGDVAPARGMYSSVSDLARLGSSFLSSDLLEPVMTRRWLKPASPTSNTVNSVGMPWEIYNSAQKITDHVIDIYMKLGNTGVYSSYIGVVPAYNVGFAILAAGEDEAPDLNAFADIIASNMLPAVVKTAALGAGKAFMGKYSAGNGTDASSVTVEVDGEPGIAITNLTSNGADTLAAYTSILGLEADTLSVRLFPTNLKTEATANEAGKFVFRAAFQDKNDLADGGTPTCISYMNIDSPTYGGAALDEFVFRADEKGSAVALEVPALRLSLNRLEKESKDMITAAMCKVTECDAE